MAEKILSTRILLKYDSYENCKTNNPILKKGEVMIATIPTNQDGVVSAPATLIKVGDGVNHYNDLQFLSAKAADVHAWAKAAEKPTYAASEITGLADYIAGEIQDTDTQYTLTKVNNYQYKLMSKAKGDEGFATEVAVIDIPDDTAAIQAVKNLIGDESVATQIGNAIAALKLAETYEAKGAAAAVKTELLGNVDTDTDASATIAGAKKYADKLDAAMDKRVDALEAAVGEGGSVGAQIDAKIQELDVADTAVDGQYVSAVSETDGKIKVTRANLPDYTDTYAAKEHVHVIADVTGLQTELDKVTTLVGTDAGKSARTIANEELVKQLIPETAKESMDTLAEIAAWIQAHPDDASAMNTRIGTLETKVGDSSVSDQINAAITALKIGDYAKAADLTAAVARIAANETAIATLKGTGEGSVAKAVSDAVAALDVEDAAVAHQVVTAVSETDGKIAVTRAQLTTDDIAAGTEVWVFDCGDSTI